MRYISTITLITFLALSTQTVNAAASKEENVGIGTGAVIGMLAGGPAGFIIGAALGAKIGDTLHSKSEEIEVSEKSLQNSRHSVIALERDIAKLNSEIDYLQSVARPELVSLMQAGIDMDLLFRTDEFALTDLTGDRLMQMADTLAAMSGVRIQLDGFADERGDSKYNLELSEKRVEFVRNIFISAGVHPTRISSSAHGESAAQNPDLDSYALERRVSVKLFIDDVQSLAANSR
ncbi:MAG: DUF456 family protein [Woeseiaceae bacterium]|nr:DUF456 family protein [Woeseiaceae bacterium]